MLGLAGHPLGIRCVFLDPAADACAAAVGPLRVAPWDDPAALDRLAGDVDLVTYEFENVPVATAYHLVRRVPVLPPPRALEVAQDRLAEKRLFEHLGVATARYAPVADPEEARAAADQVGLPAILKRRRGGYDGKGQTLVRDGHEAEAAVREAPGHGFLLEQLVPFQREVSVLAVRDRGGQVAAYPLVRNHHRGGILRWSRAPDPDGSPALLAEAVEAARRVLEYLEYVGVVAVEFFVCEGRLLANELAPRVHNSGHWTIEGAETSQFENHLRALAGWPLGSTEALGPSAMVNLIGEVPDPAHLLAFPGVHLHLYGKAPRPGRKLGHLTVRARDPVALEAVLSRVLPLVGLGSGARSGADGPAC